MPTLAIRREDLAHERRVTIAPDDARGLVAQGIDVVVQPAPQRVFTEDDYRAAGARIESDISAYPTIIGLKEIELSRLEPDRAYAFFSHTIKGQATNMPLLARLLELGASVIDYEVITDDAGRRLVFFGEHAGFAGMIDTLWALGQRLALEGVDTPLSELMPAHRYASLGDAEAQLKRLGTAIDQGGLPAAIDPLVIGVAGYGNVSRGAQHILDCLGARDVPPAALDDDGLRGVVRAVFRESDLVARREGTFELQEYYDHPDRYRAAFAPALARLHALVNCIYWDERYPRLVTRADLAELFSGDGAPRLRVIGDISCDVDGAIEATVRTTSMDAPVYVYDPSTGQARDGVEGNGPVVLAVYNLPAELPRESSLAFSTALSPFLPAIARADFRAPLDRLELPPPIRRALIAHRGEFTPEFARLAAHL